jgi:hypothetical protein
MLYLNTPIGKIQVPSWEEAELTNLNDEELLQKAFDENKKFVISPATFAMIEKRFLGSVLQKMINPNIRQSHYLFSR